LLNTAQLSKVGSQHSYTQHSFKGVAASGSAKDILKMMAQPGSLDQFLNLNPSEAIFFAKSIFENCFSHFSGLNSRVLNPTRQPKSAILNPETRFCGLRVG
jgi:hypothetical protein